MTSTVFKSKKKKSTVSTKIICDKCGKEDFVTFLADGKRKYYCNDCLTQFNLDRKRGKIKKSFDKRKDKDMYEFVCDKCEKFFRAGYHPKEVNGLIYCLDCYDEEKQAERKQKRKNVVLAK